MKTLRFEGYSDDTFGEQTTGEDHDNCANGTPIIYRVRAGEESLLVVGHYCPEGLGITQTGWMIGVSADDSNDTGDDVQIPSWPMRFAASTETPYSPALIIDAPDDATLEYVDVEAEREARERRRREAATAEGKRKERAEYERLRAKFGQ